MNKEFIKSERIKAWKLKNVPKKDILTMVLSELDSLLGEPTESEIISVMKKLIKSAKLVNTVESNLEIEILNEYLPKLMTEDEIILKIEMIKAANPDVVGGRLMGLCMKELKGVADPLIVKEILNRK